MKPGDVLTGASGKTVEVINTDAEGRLILGDGLWYAQQLGRHAPRRRRDAHGRLRRRSRQGRVRAVRPARRVARHGPRRRAKRAGDRCWPMPLYDEYFDQIRSEIADMINSGGRAGGACTAAIFLKEFTNDLPWAHMDIAGTAWAERREAVPAEGADRRRGPHAGGAAVHLPDAGSAAVQLVGGLQLADLRVRGYAKRSAHRRPHRVHRGRSSRLYKRPGCRRVTGRAAAPRAA